MEKKLQTFKDKWKLFFCWKVLCVNLHAKRDDSNNQTQTSDDEGCKYEIPISPFSLELYSKTTFADPHPTRRSYAKAIIVCLYAIFFFKKRKDIILVRQIPIKK